MWLWLWHRLAAFISSLTPSLGNFHMLQVRLKKKKKKKKKKIFLLDFPKTIVYRTHGKLISLTACPARASCIQPRAGKIQLWLNCFLPLVTSKSGGVISRGLTSLHCVSGTKSSGIFSLWEWCLCKIYFARKLSIQTSNIQGADTGSVN